GGSASGGGGGGRMTSSLAVPTPSPFRESASGNPNARREAEWDSVGIIDAGVLDLVAEEFEPQNRRGSYPAASPLGTPTQRRHPALGCQVFHSPGR
ncbi:unnamed protein product, partial [Ectocarpus sp. 6 AP-2014]